jgi:hypothetical protein
MAGSIMEVALWHLTKHWPVIHWAPWAWCLIYKDSPPPTHIHTK